MRLGPPQIKGVHLSDQALKRFVHRKRCIFISALIPLENYTLLKYAELFLQLELMCCQCRDSTLV